MSELNYERHDVFHPRHLNILLAEDNEGDIEIFKELSEASDAPHTLFVVHDGEEAWRFLQEFRPLPDLVILDINMPRKTGLEVLALMKKAPSEISQIPAVVLTSSDASRDVKLAENDKANGYVVKPPDFQMEELVNICEVFRESPHLFIKVGGDH